MQNSLLCLGLECLHGPAVSLSDFPTSAQKRSCVSVSQCQAPSEARFMSYVFSVTSRAGKKVGKSSSFCYHWIRQKNVPGVERKVRMLSSETSPADRDL